MARVPSGLPTQSVLWALLLTLHTGCSAPSEMELYPNLGAPDTVVTLSGVDFFASTTIYCRLVTLHDANFAFRSRHTVTDTCAFLLRRRIGKRMVLAKQNATPVGFEAVITCKAPKQSTGFHSVEITRNGRDFTNSGLIFHYGTPQSFNARKRNCDAEPVGCRLQLICWWAVYFRST